MLYKIQYFLEHKTSNIYRQDKIIKIDFPVTIHSNSNFHRTESSFFEINALNARN